jgi:hypothetical protein
MNKPAPAQGTTTVPPDMILPFSSAYYIKEAEPPKPCSQPEAGNEIMGNEIMGNDFQDCAVH